MSRHAMLWPSMQTLRDGTKTAAKRGDREGRETSLFLIPASQLRSKICPLLTPKEDVVPRLWLRGKLAYSHNDHLEIGTEVGHSYMKW